jgi:hypothetical protein
MSDDCEVDNITYKCGHTETNVKPCGKQPEGAPICENTIPTNLVAPNNDCKSCDKNSKLENNENSDMW